LKIYHDPNHSYQTKGEREVAKGNNTAEIGFEQQIWAAADMFEER
jgi:hypothetical protein